MVDKRNDETEQKFFLAYSEISSKKPHSISSRITDIIKKAHRSDSTFHRHYHSIDEIFTREQKKVLKKYQLLLRKFRQKTPTLRQILRGVLLFIKSNRNFFKVIFIQNNQDFFEHFMSKLTPYIKKNWFDYDSKIYHLCIGEIFLIIKSWGEKDFDLDELEKTVGDIVYLIESARPRLGPIQH